MTNTEKKRRYLLRRRLLKTIGWKGVDMGFMIDPNGRKTISKRDMTNSSQDEFKKMVNSR